MCNAQGYKGYICTYLRPPVTSLVEWRANYFNMLPFSDMIKKNRKLKFVLGPSTTFWYIQNFIRLETETSPRVYSRKLRTNRFRGTFMIELVDYIVFSCSTPTDNKKIVFSVFLSLCSKECDGISGRWKKFQVSQIMVSSSEPSVN